MTHSRSKQRGLDQQKLHIHLYAACSFFDFARFEHAWSMLQKPVIPKKLRYGRHQPYKHTLTADTRAAFELFHYDCALLFGNRDKTFEGKFQTELEGFTEWSVFIAESVWSPAWLAWLVELCSTTPILFGRACALAESQAKHEVRRVFAEGRSGGWIGATRTDLYQFLPGIYWFTVLGKELATTLDVAAVRAFSDLEIEELPGGQLALRLQGEPFVVGQAFLDRLEREKEIASALGDEYFFDRDRPDRQLRQVPAFLTTLESLRPPSGNPRPTPPMRRWT